MKNYLKQQGKTPLVSLFVVALICSLIAAISYYVPLLATAYAAGEAYPALTFILPYAGETAKTIVLKNLDNGNNMSGTLGTSTATTTWDASEIAGVRNSLGGDWTFAIPAHNIHHIYIKRYDVAPASIDKDTVSGYNPLLYNPKSGLAYTDTNPIMDNMVNVTAVQ
jgi:hypothetical protein